MDLKGNSGPTTQLNVNVSYAGLKGTLVMRKTMDSAFRVYSIRYDWRVGLPTHSNTKKWYSMSDSLRGRTSTALEVSLGLGWCIIGRTFGGQNSLRFCLLWHRFRIESMNNKELVCISISCDCCSFNICLVI